jgi:hypothetical protein
MLRASVCLMMLATVACEQAGKVAGGALP